MCDFKREKLMISIISALVFFIVANPETFKLVRRLLGSWVATPTGCPSMTGLVLHAAVFMLVVWGMMLWHRLVCALVVYLQYS